MKESLLRSCGGSPIPMGDDHPMWPKYSAMSETPAAICFNDVVRVRISAAALGSYGTELRGAASASRDSPFQRVATSTVSAEFDAAESFGPLTTAAAR